MGEKLLAQRLIRLLRETEGRSSRTATMLVEWASDHRDWLWPDTEFIEVPGDEGARGFWEALPGLAEAIDVDEPPPRVLAAADRVARLLALDPFDHAVLSIATALTRLPRLATFRSRCYDLREQLIRIVGQLAGAEAVEAAHRVRRSGPVTLGLLETPGDSDGDREVALGWDYSRALDAGLTEPDELIEALAGAPQQASLAMADFAEQAEASGLLTRLLTGALGRAAAGVNVLIYGPPGTGKTELRAGAGRGLRRAALCGR